MSWSSRDLIDSAPFGIWMLDRAGTVLESNPEGAVLLGRDQAQLVGTAWDACAQQAERESLLRIREQLVAGKCVVHDAVFQRGDGAEVRLELSFIRFGADRVIIYGRDAASRPQPTAEEQLRAEHQRYRDETDLAQQQLARLVEERTHALSANQRHLQTILDVFPGVIGSFDRNLRIRFANREYAHLFGYDLAEVRGAHLRDLVGDDWFERLQPIFIAALGGEPRSYQRALADVRQPGGTKHVQVNLIPDVTNEVVVGVIAVAFDVTDIKTAQIAAESASRAKSDFLANMSHEIRTPLNGVLGFARLGVEESGDAPLLHDFFRRISESGRLLLGVVNDVLDLSKIEAGEMQIESVPLDPRATLQGAMSLFTERARQKQLELVADVDVNVPAACLGDPLRLEQVLVNLLSNAIKFTAAGQVSVAARCAGPDLVYTVSDTGIGIDAEHIGRLFRPFEQADASIARRFGGTGLGLTITHRLTELMGGTLIVRSEPGRGSTFEVRLPLRAAPAAPPTAAGTVARVARN